MARKRGRSSGEDEIDRMARKIARQEKTLPKDCTIIIEEDFALECQEKIAEMKKELEKINGVTQKDLEHCNMVFRYAHSLKGICLIFGLKELAIISKKLESMFENARAGGICLTDKGKTDIMLLLSNFQEILQNKVGKKLEPQDIKKLYVETIGIWPNSGQ